MKQSYSQSEMRSKKQCEAITHINTNISIQGLRKVEVNVVVLIYFSLYQ